MTKIISGFADVPPELRAEFERAIPLHARLTNAEPGCHYFRVEPLPKIEGRYLFEEAFEDEAAYQAHLDRTRDTEWAKITQNLKRS